MKHYPLLFTFRDKVSGNGFLVNIVIDGRVLASQEEDGWWMYGVQPGDLAAGGSTFAEAHCEFRKAFTTILFDIAEDTEDLKTFRADVHKFFKGINHPTEKEWQAAVCAVRAGRITADAICEGLQTKPADSRRSVRVKLLKVFKTKDNILEPQMAMAA